MIEVADEVAAALAGGGRSSRSSRRSSPTACRGRTTARIAREIEARGARPAAPCRPRSRCSTGRCASGLDDAAARGGRHARRRRQAAARATSPLAAARGASGATTVAATAHVAARAGIRVFATGGLGGVHREAQETWDESADLVALSRTGDLRRLRGREVDPRRARDARAAGDARRRRWPATGTDRFPGFYLADSGHAGAVAARLAGGGRRGAARRAPSSASTGARSSSPTRSTSSSTRSCTSACSARRWPRPRAQGVRGRDVTPFLLARFHERTGGESLRANVRLVLRNAALAAQIAVAAAA